MFQNPFFPEIHGNFGFGCMRLPMKDEKVDYEVFTAMLDAFLEAGFNYFDTAHGYLNGQSEIAIGDCLASRYDRSKFLLTNKLTDSFFQKQEDIRPLFEKQLEACKVDYFDFYLMHAQGGRNYAKYQACKAYETAYSFKEEGLIRHFGISFHDKPETLDRILTEHPEIDAVQIQFNYADYEDDAIESRHVYEVCEKHGKPVIVMEPVKGGTLVNLPEDADKILKALNGGSNASYALRFAAGFPNMMMVLSGMSDFAQMKDNLSTMKDFKPLSDEERAAVDQVRAIFRSLGNIPCTGCRYCIEENQCPMNIRIPDIFAAANSWNIFHTWSSKLYYGVSTSGDHGKVADCLKCGMCEQVCPQHLPIRDLLEQADEALGWR
ncbi:MAG: aldo/keto reductase [Oscillospiraceae bacterium]|nr:aldo/keto reductase [Oscillospiraceae bacterium]